MSHSLAVILIVVVLFVALAAWHIRTAGTNHQRNLKISNLIASKFFSEYEQGTSHWITTVVNLNGTVIYSLKDVEAALRFLLGLHRIRVEANSYGSPVWIAVDLEPQSDSMPSAHLEP